jgi:truncated hemoglobin YjbI
LVLTFRLAWSKLSVQEERGCILLRYIIQVEHTNKQIEITLLKRRYKLEAIDETSCKQWIQALNTTVQRTKLEYPHGKRLVLC